MERLLSLALFFCLAISGTGFAQDQKEAKDKVTLIAYIMETTTGEAVVGTKVTIMNAKDSTVVDTTTAHKNSSYNLALSMIWFTLTEPGEYIAKCEADGYETTYNNFTIEKLYKHENYMRLNSPFYIRPPRTWQYTRLAR